VCKRFWRLPLALEEEKKEGRTPLRTRNGLEYASPRKAFKRVVEEEEVLLHSMGKRGGTVSNERGRGNPCFLKSERLRGRGKFLAILTRRCGRRKKGEEDGQGQRNVAEEEKRRRSLPTFYWARREVQRFIKGGGKNVQIFYTHPCRLEGKGVVSMPSFIL